MARPTKLTPEVQQKICAAIRAGNYPEVAARSAGVSPATFYRWMKAGKAAAAGKQRDFYEAVRRAEADAEIEAVALIRRQMFDDARLCLSFLERRWRSRWARHQSHELSGPGGEPIKIADAMLEDPETRKALREALNRAGRARANESGRTRARD